MDRHTKKFSFGWMMVLVVAAACACGGCDGRSLKAFREASGEELELGVDYPLDGVIDGFFEIWTPDSSSSADQSTTTSSS